MKIYVSLFPFVLGKYGTVCWDVLNSTHGSKWELSLPGRPRLEQRGNLCFFFVVRATGWTQNWGPLSLLLPIFGVSYIYKKTSRIGNGIEFPWFHIRDLSFSLGFVRVLFPFGFQRSFALILSVFLEWRIHPALCNLFSRGLFIHLCLSKMT